MVNYNLVQGQRRRNRMRGDQEQQAGMYSYISPEQRVPADHPLRPLRKMTDEIFKQLSPRFDKLYASRAAVDRAGAVAASVVAASALLGAQRADVDGAVAIQHVVPLVRGPEHGRRGLERDHFQQEP